MKKRLAGALLLGALSMCGCASWDDNPNSAIIQGWVTDAASGRPVAGVRVCAMRPSDDRTFCSRSEETEGFYRITASWLESKDRYIRMTAIKDGYRPFQLRVKTLDLESVAEEPIPGFPYVLNIELRPEN